MFVPLAGAAVLLLVRRDAAGRAKWIGMAASLLTFVVSVVIYMRFDAKLPGMQFVEHAPWIPSLNIGYTVGVDGISMLLLLLTTFLTPIALLSSWASIEKKVREFVMMMLLLETGMIGVFCSLDLILFYVFWEAMLIPMYFIIGIWGGNNRIYAAVKFFLYTMVGSLLMLVAIIWLGYYASLQPDNVFTTNFAELLKVGPAIPLNMQIWLFLAFTLSFAIKVPLFPFHTWLPDAHVEAPTAGSVILAGVLLKMGTYGLIRFCLPLFPQSFEAALPYLGTLAVVGVVYGALVSMVQTDMKKLVAYSSVSHLGFVVLGILSLTEEGIQGSVLQMVNHGLSTGALFLIVGMIYDRRHTRAIADFVGLAKVMPLLAIFLFIVSLSSIGLPGLNGFVGEFLILLGSYKTEYLSHWFAISAASGVIFAAVYLLWMYQRVIFGPNTNPANQHLTDLSAREIGLLVPVLLFIVWIGVYPGPFLDISAAAVQKLVAEAHALVKPGGGL